MNENKLNRILETVRAEPPPAVPADFARRVLRQVRREPGPDGASLLDQLYALFPKLACAAVVVICFCVAGDLLLGAFGLPDLGEGVQQIAGQWFVPENGI
jgi:hypothetical protein